MKLGYLSVLLCLCPMLAQAEIYKSVDADGHVTYSNTPIKGGKKLNLEPLPTMAPYSDDSARNFPRVDSETQKARDETRRKILQDELTSEEKLLEKAKQDLDNAPPEVFKGSDGKTYRNVAKYEENVKSLQEQVDLHQNNIDALKNELAKLK